MLNMYHGHNSDWNAHRDICSKQRSLQVLGFEFTRSPDRADMTVQQRLTPDRHLKHHYIKRPYEQNNDRRRGKRMEKCRSDIIPVVARIMADSFKGDPLNRAVFRGVRKSDRLLYAHARIHISYALNNGYLRLLNGSPEAFLIGMDSKNRHPLGDLLLNARVVQKTFTTLGIGDLRRILSNYKKISKVVNSVWHREFTSGRYYRLKIIAIDKNMRGTGAFRRLLTPVLEYCDTESIPMVLETHNERNVGLYIHFGFELVKTLTARNTEVTQYCMIRKPDAGTRSNAEYAQ